LASENVVVCATRFLTRVPNNALLIFVIIDSQLHYMATIAATNFIDILASILEDCLAMLN